MPLEIKRTSEQEKPTLVFCVYGAGGTGKTTLASTAPKPVFLDAEEGTKGFRAQGIDAAVADIKVWRDVQDAMQLVLNSKEYETIVIDPMDAFLNILIDDVKGAGEMALQKWGTVKDRMRRFVWGCKKSGKHVVFIAHEEEKDDEGKLIRGPKLAANLAGELVDLCDVVGHLRVGEGRKRELLVAPDLKYKAKDRFGVLEPVIKEPNVSSIISKIHAKYV